MERLDLSTYAKEIKQDYSSVVSGEHTYAIFTTLKDSSLKPTNIGDGDITEFVSEFEEGSVQFGVIRVNPFGSDVHKLVLLGWCPDSAPLKSKVSFASNFSEVGKVLHYHVEITARDSDDLDINDIMKTVSNASGARYSIQSLTPQSKSNSTFKPSPKPASIINKSSPPVELSSIIKPKPAFPLKKIDKSNDGWGDEKEIQERDFSEKPLENLPSAYKPTKVDINALRNSKPESNPSVSTIPLNPSGGLTSLPKPKPSHSVLSRYNEDVVKPEFGTKAPTFGSIPSNDNSKLVGGLSRNFGAQGGKTPAQLWAERKGQYKELPKDDKPVNSSESVDSEDINVGDVKSKFEKIQLEAEKEEKEEQEESKEKSNSHQFKSSSIFPPPNARESIFPPPAKGEEQEEPKSAFSGFPPPTPNREDSKPVSSFPPPPKRDNAPFDKFKEAEDEQEEGWDDEEPKKSEPMPVPLPPRVAEPEPVEELHVAIAEYDYEKDEDNEIGFFEGEKITQIKFVDEDWWFGTNSKGDEGLFPSSYVKLSEPSNYSATVVEHESEVEAEPEAESEPETKASGISAVSEYEYEAAESNELSFKEGDIITDIDKVDEDWWLGSLNGERKLFPANYVTLQ